MNLIARRDFLKCAAAGGIAGLGLASAATAAETGAGAAKRKFTMCLSCGPIGVPGDPRKEPEWASRFGFEAIEPAASFLAKLSDAELAAYREDMRQRKLAWGAAGFPVQFRGDESAYAQSLKSLPEFAKTLQRAGVTRVATWLSPGHRTLTYLANFKLHAKRMRESAAVLGDFGIRLGLEYVGPKTSWSAGRFPFIHTMAEMKELIAEIGRDNVGFLLDSWHWYTAHETEAELLSLRATDVVLCHLNDAPKGVAIDQQMDGRRELPAATGVIDLKTFLGALAKIGYDGPVLCEPLGADLRGLSPEQRLEKVAAAMKAAFALVD